MARCSPMPADVVLVMAGAWLVGPDLGLAGPDRDLLDVRMFGGGLLAAPLPPCQPSLPSFRLDLD
jgi:hypothetical protein